MNCESDIDQGFEETEYNNKVNFRDKFAIFLENQKVKNKARSEARKEKINNFKKSIVLNKREIATCDIDYKSDKLKAKGEYEEAIKYLGVDYNSRVKEYKRNRELARLGIVWENFKNPLIGIPILIVLFYFVYTNNYFDNFNIINKDKKTNIEQQSISNINHIVKKGETISDIIISNNIKFDNFEQMNAGKNLHAGDLISIRDISYKSRGNPDNLKNNIMIYTKNSNSGRKLVEVISYK